MERSKHYRRLTVSGRNVIDRYKQNRKKADLFRDIKRIINSQNTINARAVARSQFRGILRAWFKFSNEDLKPIEATDEEKQEYFDKQRESREKKIEDIITDTILQRILSYGICELLIRSGLRISELLENNFKFSKSGVKFQLNKKPNEYKREYYDIYIMGDIKDWREKFEKVRNGTKDKTPKQIYDKLNRQLKSVIPAGFSKRSTHICRAIYVRMLYKFKKGTFYSRWGLPRIIQTFLHHDNLNSVGFYQGVEISDDVTNIGVITQ